MTTEQTKHIIRLLTDKGVHFDSGLTDDEVLQVETKFDFKFPPDLKLFLQTALPTSDRFINWRIGLKSKDETDKIIDRLGLLADSFRLRNRLLLYTKRWQQANKNELGIKIETRKFDLNQGLSGIR